MPKTRNQFMLFIDAGISSPLPERLRSTTEMWSSDQSSSMNSQAFSTER